MVLICDNIDMDHIRMFGRWYSDSMIWHLRMQAQSMVRGFTSAMFKRGSYSFLPEGTAPKIDLYDDPWPHHQPPPTPNSMHLTLHFPTHPNTLASGNNVKVLRRQTSKYSYGCTSRNQDWHLWVGAVYSK
jgi:hypothetical protein